jgi:hypothetical protein
MKRYTADGYREDANGEFALASDLDEALDLLQRWKNRRNGNKKFQLWMDTTKFISAHRGQP